MTKIKTKHENGYNIEIEFEDEIKELYKEFK